MPDPPGHLPGREPTGPTPSERALRLRVTPSTALLVAVGLLAAVGTWNAVVAARSVLAMAFGSAVLAIIASSPVGGLSRWMPRGLAIVAVVVVGLGLAGGLGAAVVADVDGAFDRLEGVAPEAAAVLADSDRFGSLATDLQVEQRVADAVERLRNSTEKQARDSAVHGVTYFVALILAIFLLVYGPRFGEGALGQVRDPARRDSLARTGADAFARARDYLVLQLLNALVIGVIAAVVLHAIGVPGASGLAFLAALASVVPDVGVVIGAVPALLLVAAFEPLSTLLALLAGTLVVQALDIWADARLFRQRLDVGAAVTLVSALLGFGIYGIGGALFGVAAAVLASAVLEAAGRERQDVSDEVAAL